MNEILKNEIIFQDELCRRSLCLYKRCPPLRDSRQDIEFGKPGYHIPRPSSDIIQKPSQYTIDTVNDNGYPVIRSSDINALWQERVKNSGIRSVHM